MAVLFFVRGGAWSQSGLRECCLVSERIERMLLDFRADGEWASRFYGPEDSFFMQNRTERLLSKFWYGLADFFPV